MITAGAARAPFDMVYSIPPDLVGEEDHFVPLRLDVAKMVHSWRSSLGAVGWFHPDGSLRRLDELPSGRAQKVAAILGIMENGKAVSHPVCGIGVMETIEIGIGADVVVAFFYRKLPMIDVLVPKTMQGDFTPFLRSH